MSGWDDKAALRNRLDDYKPVLNQERFISPELPGDFHDRQSTLEFMKRYNAITWVERTIPEGKKKPLKVWEWQNYRTYLQGVLEDRDELPCGDRAHIPAQQDGETYYCKFCGEGHDRDTIQEAI
jgi:hypothetical protein